MGLGGVLMSLKMLPSFGLNTTVAKATSYFDELIPRDRIIFYILCCRGDLLSAVVQMQGDSKPRSPGCADAKIRKICDPNEQE